MNDLYINDYFKRNGHFGLVRGPKEKEFKKLCAAGPSLNLPEVDIASLPNSLGVATWMKIEDQEQVGSCQGHARTSAEELAIYRTTNGDTIQLNRMFAYITSQLVDRIKGDNGSTIQGGAEASQTYGSCLESLWPYPGYYTRDIPDICFEEAKSRLLRSYKTLNNYDEVLQWLVHGLGGIVIGINWNNSCTPDSQGRISAYNGRTGGGHALALLDWNKQHVYKGKPFIDMYNSWSTRWGYKGRAFIHPDVINHWCEYETVIGYSDLITPAPKKFLWDTGRIMA